MEPFVPDGPLHGAEDGWIATDLERVGGAFVGEPDGVRGGYLIRPDWVGGLGDGVHGGPRVDVVPVRRSAGLDPRTETLLVPKANEHRY